MPKIFKITSYCIFLAVLSGCGARLDLSGEPDLVESAVSNEAVSSWQDIEGVIQEMVDARDLDGAYVRIAVAGEVFVDRGFGEYQSGTLLNVASATKWVSGATLMTLVDEGVLALNEPVVKSLSFMRGDMGKMTLDQMLSHTSGLPGIDSNPIDLRQSVNISLRESAEDIAGVGLSHKPGTAFDYGGASFQVAGALAEQQAGKSWHLIFKQNIADPLGMGDSFYGHPLRRHQGKKGLSNPNIQAGLHTTPDDYWRFLQMIRARGVVGDKRVLSEEAIDSMEVSRFGGVVTRNMPRAAAPHDEYGFGLWCERVVASGECPLVSSSGAWGTYPWIDRDRDVVGLVFVKDRLPNVLPWLRKVRSGVEGLVDKPAQ